MFCIHISSPVGPTLSNFSFVLGSTRESSTCPLILGIQIIYFLSNRGFWIFGVGGATSILGLYLFEWSGVNNNEAKSYDSTIFIGGNWSGNFNSSVGDINSHALVIMLGVITGSCKGTSMSTMVLRSNLSRQELIVLMVSHRLVSSNEAGLFSWGIRSTWSTFVACIS